MPTSAAEPSSSQKVGISGPCIICLPTPSALIVQRRITPPDDPSRDMARATASFTMSSASCRFMPSLQNNHKIAFHRGGHAAPVSNTAIGFHTFAAITSCVDFLRQHCCPQEMQVVHIIKVGSIVGMVRQTHRTTQRTSFSWLTKRRKQILVWLSFFQLVCNLKS